MTPERCPVPNYNYRCTKCKHTFQHQQSMTSPLLKDCPECDGNVRVVICNNTTVMKRGPTIEDSIKGVMFDEKTIESMGRVMEDSL